MLNCSTAGLAPRATFYYGQDTSPRKYARAVVSIVSIQVVVVQLFQGVIGIELYPLC